MLPDCSAARRTAVLLWLSGLLCVGCGDPQPVARVVPTGERIDTLVLAHVVGTNLPPWAACYFPHQANPYARRRAYPCSPDAQATRVYRVSELAGCWRIRESDGGDVDLVGFTGPLRLMRVPSAKMQKWRWADDGLRGIEYTASIPKARATDTAFTIAYWLFDPPDLLEIGVTTGLTGAGMAFRVRGDSLVGMLRFGGDVIMDSVDTTSDPVERLAGNRVPCTSARTHR